MCALVDGMVVVWEEAKSCSFDAQNIAGDSRPGQSLRKWAETVSADGSDWISEALVRLFAGESVILSRVDVGLGRRPYATPFLTVKHGMYEPTLSSEW